MTNPLVLTFGLLGNLVSFAVFMAPVPTFYRVWKRKSTEGFESMPYVVALFSAMLWTYYASLKADAFLLLTINSIGCFIETVYVALYLAYAPKQARVFTLRLVILNFGGFCSILLFSQLLLKESTKILVLGWLCVAFSASVFAAPLSVIRTVIRTKSTEFIPICLSFALTLSAVIWLLYGITVKDLHIALPNIGGLIFGGLQMVLFAVYRNRQIDVIDPEKQAKDIELPCPSVSPAVTANAEHHDTHTTLDAPNNHLNTEESDPKTIQITATSCDGHGQLSNN